MVIDLSFNPGFENVTEPLIAMTLSTRSDLTHKHEFLGFEDDKKHKMLK